VLYAHYVLTLTPSIVDFSEMARIIIIVVIGGSGSLIARCWPRRDQFPRDLSAASAKWSLCCSPAITTMMMIRAISLKSTIDGVNVST